MATNFIVNRLERALGVDLDGDGYIGGEGFLSKLERATHIDFNRDNIIGRPPDVLYPYSPIYDTGCNGFSSMSYGGYSYGGYSYGMSNFGYFY
ncbi:unnamed protein product [Rotaria sp. Silwood1]|nr:unnamed protein product [Rotaria sp. Silwood1]CAF3539510.1 unnamed protein product [Rotaria sp. Silwood1]CAF3640517.1 unnamed protein product [Rotaria sp. Silwood1]CAF4528422.1 unnamed protein product [Rotaria sp. Silwood1]CAF4542759.1 unnamed protein product [Rotaria sp. Silwood1]